MKNFITKYLGYDRALWLLEFINFYHLLGVTDFTFYNHSVGPNVEKVLQHYMKQKSEVSLRVLEWNLPLQSQMKIRTEAQFTAFNDCNLRYINRVKYAIMVVSFLLEVLLHIYMYLDLRKYH